MLHEIGIELDAFLRSKGVPLRVVDGPERTDTTTFARERIVIWHDEQTGDEIGPATSQRGNPQQKFTRWIGAKIRVYAQATGTGAQPYEHRRRAEKVLDAVLVGLDAVIRERKNQLKIRGGTFVQPTDLQKSEVVGGAVYELKFSVDRGVRDVTWSGEARPEATFGPGGAGIKNETNVSLAAGNSPPPVDAETACGT